MFIAILLLLLVLYGECWCEAVRSYATAQNTAVIPQLVIYKQPQSVALLMLHDKIECFTVFITCKPSIPKLRTREFIHDLNRSVIG